MKKYCIITKYYYTTIVLLDIENIFLHIKHGCNVSSPLTPQHVHPTSSGPPSRQPRDVPRNTTAGSAHESATAVSPPRTHSGDPVNKCITCTGQNALSVHQNVRRRHNGHVHLLAQVCHWSRNKSLQAGQHIPLGTQAPISLQDLNMSLAHISVRSGKFPDMSTISMDTSAPKN